MNSAIFFKIVRHLLTAFGGVGIATDSNVKEVAGAISFLAGIAWSIWEARRANPPQPPGPSVRLSLMVGLLVVGTGCASILPGNDPLVVRAQQTRGVAFATFDAFVTIEHRHRDLLWKADPGFKHTADKIREGAPKWFKSFDAALASYRSTKTQDSRLSLSGSVAFLETSLAEVQGYLTQAAEKGAQ